MRILRPALTLALIAAAINANAAGRDFGARTCNEVNSATGKVIAGVTSGAGSITAGGGIALKAIGVSSLPHSSGAAIAAVGGKYMAGTLGAIGTATGFITAPVVIGVGVVTAVGAGGLVAYCQTRYR